MDQSVEAHAETAELTRRLQVLNTEIEVQEEEICSIKQTIMSQVGQVELLTYQGKTLATWRVPKPSFRLDSKQLELGHPEIASNYKIPVQNSQCPIIKNF